MEELELALERIKELHEALLAKNAEIVDDMTCLQDVIYDMRDQNKAYLQGLDRYGNHEEGCHAEGSALEHLCSCGLRAAKDGILDD